MNRFDFKIQSRTMSIICLLIASDNFWLPNKSVLSDGGLRCDKLFGILCRKLLNLVHSSK